MKSDSFPYQVVNEFVRGGCSIIYKLKSGVDPGDQKKQFVLKAMNLAEDDPQSHQRFYMEYEFLRAYPHPNLVEVKEYFPEWQGNPAYVMEWVEGNTWQHHWGDRKGIDHISEFLNLFGQLCEVVDFIHKHQIIHRDLKPQNILISSNEVLKLIDFGIMKVADLTLYTHRNTFMGSAYYVSPEGISGETVNHTADIFALGVMLYDLFTGLKPFKGPTLGETIYQRLVKKPQPPSQIAEVPEALDGIILKMLERNPRNRYQDCAEIYKDLFSVLSSYLPNPVKEEKKPIDVLTKGPLLHQVFVNKCQEVISQKRFLYLLGGAGSGKTTVVENLAHQCTGWESIRLECQASTTELDFMQAILSHLGSDLRQRPDLQPWFEILAAALPQLRWSGGAHLQKLSHSTILSAFNRVFFSIETPFLLVIEALHDANPALRQFILQLSQSNKSPSNTSIHLVLTTRDPLDIMAVLGTPHEVPFPDSITLSEYLMELFDNCKVPLEVTELLCQESGYQLGTFIKQIHEYKQSELLFVDDGILVRLEELDSFPSQPLEPIAEDLLSDPLPLELVTFSEDQIDHLQWVALCPSGLDLNLLKVLSQTDLPELSKTIEEAEKKQLLEFQSSATAGFRWKNEQIRDFLVNLLNQGELTEHLVKIAETIEDQSAQYLPHSPPLWLVLCRLYLDAGKPEEAAKYAFQHARYCFQNDNYGPLREILPQFCDQPLFQQNLDYWCMLALAHSENDHRLALEFGRRALSIKECVQTFSLMTILEFFSGNEAKAGEYLDQAFKQVDFPELDIHLLIRLLPITVALGRYEDAERLYENLTQRLKGRNDIFAQNIKHLAQLELLRPFPRRLLSARKKVKVELLPQTELKLVRWSALSYQELFQYQNATNEILFFDQPGPGQVRFFREMIFLNLNFKKIGLLKNLVTRIRRECSDNKDLEVLLPLCQLITEMVIEDPKIYQSQHVLQLLAQADLLNSEWLALVASSLNLDHVDPNFYAMVVDRLRRAASPWAYHQLGRLEILSMLQDGQNAPLGYLFQSALSHCEECDLVMEALRLEGLRVTLERRSLLPDSNDSSIPQSWMESPDAVQFLHKIMKLE